MPDIVITPNRGTSNNPKIDFTGTSAGTIKLEVLADGSIAWNGANGSLFSIADSLSGSLMSVNDISGLPAFEVFSDNRVIVGQFGANLLLGKTTSSSNGRLQLANHTTVAGGIGIGTDINLYRSAAGSLSIASSANPTQLKVSTTTAGGYSQIYLSNPTRDFILTNNAGDSLLSFNYSGANRLQFDTSNQWFNSGNVGIGTTSPSQKLEVNGNASIINAIAANVGGDGSSFNSGISMWGSPNSTTSLSMFKSWASIFGRTNTLLTESNGYATYHIMDTSGRGWVWRYATGGSAGTNVASLRNDTGQLSLGTSYDWSAGYHAQLNIAAGQGSATTYRDIDMHGSWSAGEGHAISATHSVGSSNIVGQIVFQHDSPGSRIKFGRLYHSGDQSGYPLELISTGANVANLVLNNGNINVAAGNVSIGTTNFDTGNGNIGATLKLGSNNNNLIVAETTTTNRYLLLESRRTSRTGGARNAQISIGGDASDNGEMIFFTAPSSADVSERMRIISNGNVGIGTSSPSQLLHVVGGARFASEDSSWTFDDSTNKRFGIVKKGGSYSYITAASGAIIGFAHSNNLDLGSSVSGQTLSERMRIDTNGNVGIGTTSPASKLHVAGAGNSAGGNILMGSQADGTIKWSYLCGTHYNGTTEAKGVALIGCYATSTDNLVTLGGSIYESNPATAIAFYTHTANTHTTGGSEKMRIISNGNVGIATTSPSYKLHVEGDSYSSTGFYVRNSAATFIGSVNNMSGISVNGTSYDTFIVSGGNQTITVKSGGNVGINQTSPSYKLDVNGSLNSTSYYTSGTAGYIYKKYTFDLSAQSSTQFFPIRFTNTPNLAGGIHDFEVVMDSFGGGDPYNHHSVLGKARGSGWTDLPSFFDIFHNCYDNAERSYLGLYKGTQSCTDLILYVRGGKIYYVKTPSDASVSTSALSISDSVFAIKNSSGADASGTSANISFMINLLTANQGRMISHTTSVAALGVNTQTPAYAADVSGNLRSTTDAHFATSSGSVGIGNTSPSYKLHVSGDIYANGGWFRVSSSSGIYWETYGGGWYMNDSTWLRAYNDKAIITNNEIRGTIFVDANDTAYYVNPATGTNLNGTLVNNGGTLMTGSWNRNLLLTSTFPVIVFNSNNTKYSGIGVDYSSTASGMYFWVNGSSADISGTATVALGLNTGNFVTAYGSFRAPVFYDSNDTAYYTDPASTSILSKLSVGNAPYVAALQAGALELGRTDTNYQYISGWTGTMQGGILANCADNWEFVIHDSGHRLASAFEFRGSGTNVIRLGRDLGWGVTPIETPGNLTIIGNAYAPVYYDYNDTNYYVDPASTSRVNTISFVSGASFGPYLQFNNQSNLRLQAGQQSGAIGISGYDFNGNWKFQLYGDSSGYGFLNGNWAGWDLLKSVSGNLYLNNQSTYYIGTSEIYYNRVYGLADIRSPIFYDNNDTGYYVDPANGGFVLRGGTSNRVTFSTTDSGIFVANAEGGGTTVRLGAAWGCPGVYNNTSLTLGAESNIEFRIASAQKGYIDSSSNLIALGSMRSPIFYDYDNTGYYVDPNSTSVLWRPSAATQQRWGISWRAVDAGAQRTGQSSDPDYWTTTIGWGTGYGTWADYWKYGAGAFDCWGYSTDHPQGSGYIHAQGIQSGLHYANSNGTTAYGWQMVGAADAGSRWWLRGKWGGTTNPWYEIALFNRNVGGILYADLLYDAGNTGYYVDPASTSVLNNTQINYNQGNFECASNNNSSTSYSVAAIELRETSFGSTSGYLAPRLGFHWGGVVASQIGIEASGRIKIIDNPGTSYEAFIAAIVYGDASVRGPLFYDSNNTAYYFDGASTSVANNVQITTLGVGTAASGTGGEIRATNNITAYYSDERLKTRLGKIEDPIAKVKSLSGFYFEANETAVALGYDKKREVGVSAQEVQAVLPEIIAPAPISDKYMTVRYEKLIPLLIEAIKEQQTQIEQLSNELKSLKNKL